MPCLTCFLLPLEDALSHLLPGGRMPYLTCCPEDALSHLLPGGRMPYLTCCPEGGCLISPAARREDALSHLLPGGCPCLTCCPEGGCPCLTCCPEGGCPCLTCCPEDALSHLLPGGRMPCLTCFLLPRRCHLLIFPCGAVVSDLLVLPPGDWSVLTCRLLIERCRFSLHDFLPTGGCNSFFLPSADWRLPGLSTCCVVWMEAAVDLVLPASSLPRGHSRSACSLAVDWGPVAIHAALP